jgi:F-type H+-transporting ATPase subunit epsilon
MSQFKLEVVTPTGRVVQTETDQVTAPGAKGEVGILPQHRAALIQLGGGTIRFTGGEVLVRGGVAEVRADGVLVLADEAVLPAKADRARAEAILQAAVAGLADTRQYIDDETLARLATDRAFAEAVLKVAGH